MRIKSDLFIFQQKSGWDNFPLCPLSSYAPLVLLCPNIGASLIHRCLHSGWTIVHPAHPTPMPPRFCFAQTSAQLEGSRYKLYAITFVDALIAVHLSFMDARTVVILYNVIIKQRRYPKGDFSKLQHVWPLFL